MTSMVSQCAPLNLNRVNAKLGKGIIKSSIHDVISNEQTPHNMIIKCNLNVVNCMEICSGIFTRVNNRIVGEKSVLYYAIVSDEFT